MQPPNSFPESFWIENVSASLGKHNIAPEAWDRICKMRNTPIRILRDIILGSYRKPHTVIPEGCKGYIIDYPEAFFLSDTDLLHIELETKYLPTVIFGHSEVVFLADYDYEIVPPFFDMEIADFALEYLIEGIS